MIIPDANLLIYAHDQQSPCHAQAKRWWEDALSGTEPIGLPWVVLLAFVRIMTHTQICSNPLSVKQVQVLVKQWMESRNTRIVQLSENALDTYFDLLADAGLGGNLSTDAMIALHAREYSATIYSNDRDFDRFGGIRWITPLN